MIVYRTGDILESQADAIVIPVNCYGVAGAGLAYQAKLKFPYAMSEYVDACRSGMMMMGKVVITYATSSRMQRIILFPTKVFPSDLSKLGEVKDALHCLRWCLSILPEIRTIAMPKVGCGLGKLNWDDVHKLIIDIFGESFKRATVFLYT